MRWAGRVAYMGEKRGAYGVLMGKPEGKKPLEDTGVIRRIVNDLFLNIKFIFDKQYGGEICGLG
jgi:hypothetical protein